MRWNWIKFIQIVLYINAIITGLLGLYLLRVLLMIPDFFDPAWTPPYRLTVYLVVVFFGFYLISNAIIMGFFAEKFEMGNLKITLALIIYIFIDIVMSAITLVRMWIEFSINDYFIQFFFDFSSLVSTVIGLGIDLLLFVVILIIAQKHMFLPISPEKAISLINLRKIMLILGVWAIIINLLGIGSIGSMNLVKHRDYGNLMTDDYENRIFLSMQNQNQTVLTYGLTNAHMITAEREFFMLYYPNRTDHQIHIMRCRFSSDFDNIETVNYLPTPLQIQNCTFAGLWVNTTDPLDLHYFTIEQSLNRVHKELFYLLEFNSTNLINNRTFPALTLPEDWCYDPNLSFGINNSLLWILQEIPMLGVPEIDCSRVSNFVKYDYPSLDEIDRIDIYRTFNINTDLEGNLWFWSASDPLGRAADYWSSRTQPVITSYYQFTESPGIDHQVHKTIQIYHWDDLIFDFYHCVARFISSDHIFMLYTKEHQFVDWEKNFDSLETFIIYPLFNIGDFSETYIGFGGGIIIGVILIPFGMIIQKKRDNISKNSPK